MTMNIKLNQRSEKKIRIFVALLVLLTPILQTQAVTAIGGGRMATAASSRIFGTHSVMFMYGTGLLDFITKRVDHGETVEKPEDPVRDGYVFRGWFPSFETDEPFDFNTPITMGIMLHARWEVAPEIWSVDFNLHGGVMTPDFDPQQIEDGEYAKQPTVEPQRDGYEFVGWFTLEDEGELFDFLIPVIMNLTIHAQWEYVPSVPIDPEPDPDPPITNPDPTPPVTPPEPDPDPPITDPDPTPPVTSPEPDPDPTPDPIPPVTPPTPDPIPPVTPPMPDPIPPVTPPIPDPIPPVIPPTPPNEGRPNRPQTPPNQERPNRPQTPPDVEHSLIGQGPPPNSGINMEVGGSSTIVISGFNFGNNQITLLNVPNGIDFLRAGEYSEVFVVFPEGTDAEEIDVDIYTPDDELAWTYEFFDDVEDRLVLALLPPGLDLATVLRDPLNPQPRDQSLLEIAPPESSVVIEEAVQHEEEDETDIDEVVEETENYQSETTASNSYSNLPNEDIDYREQSEEELSSVLPQTGIFTNSLALFAALLVKSGQLIYDKKKIIE